MANKTRTFSDLDFNFTAHPITGDLVRKFDDSAINASLRNLILTNFFERPFHSEIAGGIRGLLFEPASPMLDLMLTRAIEDTINNHEPRVQLVDVQVTTAEDSNALSVSITYKIINTVTPITLNIVLERTR